MFLLLYPGFSISHPTDPQSIQTAASRPCASFPIVDQWPFLFAFGLGHRSRRGFGDGRYCSLPFRFAALDPCMTRQVNFVRNSAFLESDPIAFRGKNWPSTLRHSGRGRSRSCEGRHRLHGMRPNGRVARQRLVLTHFNTLALRHRTFSRSSSKTALGHVAPKCDDRAMRLCIKVPINASARRLKRQHAHWIELLGLYRRLADCTHRLRPGVTRGRVPFGRLASLSE
jgi:hypothetical protein